MSVNLVRIFVGAGHQPPLMNDRSEKRLFVSLLIIHQKPFKMRVGRFSCEITHVVMRRGKKAGILKAKRTMNVDRTADEKFIYENEQCNKDSFSSFIFFVPLHISPSFLLPIFIRFGAKQNTLVILYANQHEIKYFISPISFFSHTHNSVNLGNHK